MTETSNYTTCSGTFTDGVSLTTNIDQIALETFRARLHGAARLRDLYRIHHKDLTYLGHFLDCDVKFTSDETGKLEAISDNQRLTSYRITIPKTTENCEAFEFAAYYYITTFHPGIRAIGDWRVLPPKLLDAAYEYVAIFGMPPLPLFDHRPTADELMRLFGRKFRQSAQRRAELYEELHF